MKNRSRHVTGPTVTVHASRAPPTPKPQRQTLGPLGSSTRAPPPGRSRAANEPPTSHSARNLDQEQETQSITSYEESMENHTYNRRETLLKDPEHQATLRI
jgi:hypothetical protein